MSGLERFTDEDLKAGADELGLETEGASRAELISAIEQQGGAGVALPDALREADYEESPAERQPGEEPAFGMEGRSYEELYGLAQENDVEGRSSMTKDQLIAALREKGVS